ncbi:unnamed protein product [Ascophyllum nodosum]
MEVSRSKIENGVAYLCSYISSLQLRGDTQASLLLGISVGVVVVIFVAAFPGKPIDYSGVGIDLVPEMKYGEATPSAPTKKDKADGNPEAVLLPQEEQDSEGVTEATQGLRQRKGKNLDSTRVKETVAKTETPEGAHKNAATGEWDPSQLDEDRLARRMSSSKAARMLGLTEDQVRRVVLDTKQELQQKSRGEGHAAPGSRHEDGSAGLSRAFSTVLLVTGLGVFWLFVWTHPHGPLARFLIGAFPREMETLGFIHDRMS